MEAMRLGTTRGMIKHLSMFKNSLPGQPTQLEDKNHTDFYSCTTRNYLACLDVQIPSPIDLRESPKATPAIAPQRVAIVSRLSRINLTENRIVIFGSVSMRHSVIIIYQANGNWFCQMENKLFCRNMPHDDTMRQNRGLQSLFEGHITIFLVALFL